MGEVMSSRVDALIVAGFEQVSRKYRTLARLPAGKTGLEALAEVDAALAARFLQNANEHAAEQYRRCFARHENKVELTIDEFNEYLEKTGRKGSLR
jgi:hypothetical protein